MSKRILIADDHDVVRQGVRLILRKQKEWQIIGEAENGADAMEKIKSLKPDLVILDISMPGKDGLEIISEMKKSASPTKILVLTMHESTELAASVQQSGASGYVVKTGAGSDLIRAMQEIFDGRPFFPSQTASSPAVTKETPEKKGGTFRVSLEFPILMPQYSHL
jgi:DNA-binding NarL/FixJ family response regulator